MVNPSSGPSRAQQVGQQKCPPVGSGTSPPPPRPGHRGLCSSLPGSLVTVVSPADPPAPPSPTLSWAKGCSQLLSEQQTPPQGARLDPLQGAHVDPCGQGRMRGRKGPTAGEVKVQGRTGRSLEPERGTEAASWDGPYPHEVSKCIGLFWPQWPPDPDSGPVRVESVSRQPHSCDPLLGSAKWGHQRCDVNSMRREGPRGAPSALAPPSTQAPGDPPTGRPRIPRDPTCTQDHLSWANIKHSCRLAGPSQVPPGMAKDR